MANCSWVPRLVADNAVVLVPEPQDADVERRPFRDRALHVVPVVVGHQGRARGASVVLGGSTRKFTFPVAAAPHPGAADGVPATSDVETVILDLCSCHASKGFGFGRSIDARKLQSAKKTFPMPLDLKVYGLVDATLLGTNEKGLAITANGIYWKNGWTQETARTHLSWDEFRDIQIAQRFNKFDLGPGNFYETTGSSYPNGLLNQLLHALQASVRLINQPATLASVPGEICNAVRAAPHLATLFLVASVELAKARNLIKINFLLSLF